MYFPLQWMRGHHNNEVIIMDKRKLGNSELFVSKMGLGCMSLGTDEKQAAKIIHTALDNGINYFDTADLYEFGANEEIVGKTLKSVRSDIILATKVGNKWGPKKDSWSWDASKQHIKNAVKDSLLRLQTDYIDLYQLHGGTMEDNHIETIEAFEELVEEGVIRSYGISSIRPNVIASYFSKSNIASVMMQYSLLDRRPEEYFSLFKDNEANIVARGPVAKGLLSDRMLEKASDSIIENGFLNYKYDELELLLGNLKERFQSRGLHEVALQYVLSNKEVASVVPGASSAEQVLKNIEAVNSEPLTENELTLLQSLTIANKYEQHRI